MSSWMDHYDAVFFITVITIITGFLGLVIKFCLKSKCENIVICYGFLNIKRRVDLEVEEEMKEIELKEEVKENDNKI